MSILPRITLTALTAAALIPAPGAANTVCATPAPIQEAFSRGSTKVLGWTQGSPQGGGYVIEVAASGTLDPDGSFADAEIVRLETSVPASWRQFTFEGLQERTHYYHLRAQAKSGSGACSQSPWSPVVTTTQDATNPSASLATEHGKPFLFEDVAIEGVATDPAGPLVSSGSGVASILVQLSSLSPWGPLLPQPTRRTVTPQPDGTWRAVFADAQPGQYRARTTVYDVVGNASDPVDITVTVVRAPHA